MIFKRALRWGAVLLLVVVLPGLTVALAQGGEPTGPQSPAAWNVYESEPNDYRDAADWMTLGDVMGGFISWEDSNFCNNDYFRFNMPEAGIVLIDIDTTAIGSHLDPNLRLYAPDGTFLTAIYNYDLEHEAVLFYSLNPGTHYILVSPYDDEFCGQEYYYELIVSSPLLVSASAANLGTATVAGIPFRSEDILAHSDLNNGQQRWVMFFDGSDVGLKTVTNIESNGGDQLLLSVATNHTLPGAGFVTPWDMVLFDASQYGADTQGTFLMGFNGRMNDLTASGEKLDAIAASQYCDYLSTTGTATVPFYMGYNIKFKDEDLGCWYTDIEWLFGFESRNVPGMPVEDVFAAAYDDAADKMYLTILGSGQIAGHRVTQKDIFAINYPGYTWDGLAWHGPDHGWNYNIDAVEFNGW